jgi:hypothetical protein
MTARLSSTCERGTKPEQALSPQALARLRSALEASWDSQTAYLGAWQAGNPALGQCYPTSRVVQWLFSHLEIVAGQVDTGSALEWHFWNVDPLSDPLVHIDLTWKQFPSGSRVKHFKLLNRHALGDSPPTVERCRLLLDRVLSELTRSAAARRYPIGEARI